MVEHSVLNGELKIYIFSKLCFVSSKEVYFLFDTFRDVLYIIFLQDVCRFPNTFKILILIARRRSKRDNCNL